MTTIHPLAPKLERLRDRLIAVNMRSRTIRLSRLTSTTAIDLARLKPKQQAQLMSTLDQPDFSSLFLSPAVGQGRDTMAHEFKTLASACQKEREESGADTLAFGWPLLEGFAPDGTWVRAPLFIYPASLTKRPPEQGGVVGWWVDTEGEAGLNEPLLHTLLRLCGISLNYDRFAALDKDGCFTPDEETWTHLLQALREQQLFIANEDDSRPKKGFQALMHPKMPPEEMPQHGIFWLHHTLILGRFPLSASSNILDYQSMLEPGWLEGSSGSDHVLHRLLGVDEQQRWSQTPLQDFKTPSPSNPLMYVLDSDSSQDAVCHTVRGESTQSIVVQGPPGTGKSQMIANLIADAIGQGKRVALVCQKRAALDVVASRLSALGLSSPLALVHDIQRDRTELFVHIKHTLDDVLGASEQTKSRWVDAQSAYQRASTTLQRRLQASQKAWEIYTGANKNNERPGLVTLLERALDHDPAVLEALPRLDAFAKAITEDALQDAKTRTDALAIETMPYAFPHPWYERQSLAERTPKEVANMQQGLQAMLEHLGQRSALKISMTPEESLRHGELWEEVRPLLNLLESGGTKEVAKMQLFWLWCEGEREQGAWRKITARLERGVRDLRPTPYGLILKDRVWLQEKIEQLQVWQELEGKWWRVLTLRYWKLRGVTQEVFEAMGHGEDGGLVNLKTLCEQAISWQELIEDLPTDNAFFDFGFQGDPEQLSEAIEQVEHQNRLVRCVHVVHQSLARPPYDVLPEVAAPERLEELGFFATLWGDASHKEGLEMFQQWCSQMGRQWFHEGWKEELEGLYKSWEHKQLTSKLQALLEVAGDVEELVRLDRLQVSEPPWHVSFLRHWQGGHEMAASEALEQAVEVAWVRFDRQDRNLESLRAPLVEESHRRRLWEAVEHAKQVAPAGILATYKQGLSSQGESKLGLIGLQRLMAEVSKQSRRLSTRQLIERYWDIGLAQAQPIWLCSPEAVSALFPLQPDLFDVMIFDEASQCPMESAIGPLARAKSLLVAGDDQQMPPSHFFKATEDLGDEEDESRVLLTSRSLLEVARVALSNITLQWHYRSAHEELIAFSNTAFYGGKLLTAPRASHLEKSAWEGIHFEHVPEGLWEEQTNMAEATRVVDLVEKMLTLPTRPTVGVVSFNLKQAHLIEELIEQRCGTSKSLDQAVRFDAKRPVVDRLFVRNLENVQGDERDVLIMSVGYAPTEAGGSVAARFGPLSLAGGENRLNVAITRAKLALWVVASFEPESLQVSGTKQVGPKLLKLFLEYAKAQHEDDREHAGLLLKDAAALVGAPGVAYQKDALEQHKIGARTKRHVQGELKRRGLVLKEDVGLGSLKLDLAVEHGEGPVGVDTTVFLSTPSALTRDVYHPRFWARMGWEIVRITPDLWEEERERIVAKLGGGA